VKAVEAVLERADEGKYGGKLVTSFSTILRYLVGRNSGDRVKWFPSSNDDGLVIDATAVEYVALLRLPI